MKYLRLRHHGAERLGRIVGDRVELLEGDLFGEHRTTGETVLLEGIDWLMPCVPPKMIIIVNNFHAAVQKSGGSVPQEPLFVVRSPTALNWHRQPIPKPVAFDGRVFYEGELGVVVGRVARNLDETQAAAAIFGYTCVNDVSALELVDKDPSFAQWTRAKSFDGFGVFGPVIETDVLPPDAEVVTTVGGRERQRYPVSDMIIPPARLVSMISRDMTLMPGDVICCGTSVGVLPMKPGSTVEVTVSGVGTLSNVYAPQD
jgi:2-keto-4-pentenoate hydratase/2-oxohepta-3-ene-1,7-dioic acid hydratase in catechol pathway